MKQLPFVGVANFGATARDVGRIGVGWYMVPGRRGRNEANLVKTIGNKNLELSILTLDLVVNNSAVCVILVTANIQLNMLIDVRD